MIFTDRTITVRKGESRIDEPIVVYRGDYELEVRFTILNSRFKFMSGTNMIESEKASYGQLAILTPYGGNIFSDVVKCNDGSVTFVLTAEMLNQIEEVGLYSFQIRLMDYNKESRVSIPPIEFGIEVREPIASEDHDNSVNNAIVGYSIAKVVDPKEENVGDTFDENGNYIKTKWKTGDRISEGKLNKIEDAIDKINENEVNNTAVLSRRIDNNFNVLDSIMDEIKQNSQEEIIEIESELAQTNAQLSELKSDLLFSNNKKTNGFYARKPVVVFTLDDGTEEDYTLFKDFAEISLGGIKPTVYTNRLDNRQGALTKEQILELHELGWEFGSHTKDHVFLNAVRGRGAFAQNSNTITINCPYDYSLTNSVDNYTFITIREDGSRTKKEDVKVVSISPRNPDDTAIITLATPLKHDYNSPIVRLSDYTIKEQLEYIPRQLLEIGVPCHHFAYPYGEAYSEVRKIVPKFFLSGRGAKSTGTSINGGVEKGIENPLDTYYLDCVDLPNMSTSDIDSSLEKIKQTNGMSIFLIHSRWLDQSRDKAIYIYNKCKDLDIEIMSLGEALQFHENLIDISQGTHSFSVAHEGSVCGGFNSLQPGKYKNDDVNTYDLPYGVSSMRSYVGDAGGFPTSAGTFINIRSSLNDEGTGWNPQFWADKKYQELYYRNTIETASSLHHPWIMLTANKKYDFNTHSFDDGRDAFNQIGFHHELRTSDLAQFPESLRGVLITDNFDDHLGYIKQNYKIINSNREYCRTLKGDGMWSDFEQYMIGKSYRLQLGEQVVNGNGLCHIQTTINTGTNFCTVNITPRTQTKGLIINSYVQGGVVFLELYNPSQNQIVFNCDINVSVIPHDAG